MSRNIVTFYNLATHAVEVTAQADADKRITWQYIKDNMSDLVVALSKMKFKDPADGEESVKQFMNDLHDKMVTAFRNLTD